MAPRRMFDVGEGEPPPAEGNALLLEAGDYVLLESGDRILLEA